jgi:hypothetical protein
MIIPFKRNWDVIKNSPWEAGIAKRMQGAKYSGLGEPLKWFAVLWPGLWSQKEF